VSVGRTSRDVIGVGTGNDDGNRADPVRIRIVAENEVAGQVVLDREGLETGRAQGAAAALAHLFVVVEDVDHRANVCHCAEDRIRVAVGIDQAKDVIAVATGIARSRGRRGTFLRGLGCVIVGPQNLARHASGDGGSHRAAAVAQTARLQWRD
jgi:hypothetical protein